MITCKSDAALKLKNWIKNRQGVAVWNSVNLSNPGGQWLTPVMDENGNPISKPTWQAESTPQIITDEKQIIVEHSKVIKRLHVAVRRHGLSLKLTDAGSRKVRGLVDKYTSLHGEAWYEFDYSAYENCLIMISDKKVLLSDWKEEN